MTNQQIPADQVREILNEWERIKEYADWDDMDALVKDIRALLPTSPRPTMADMTTEERWECEWMQCDVEDDDTRAVIVNPYWSDGSARVMWPGGLNEPTDWEKVTPRPDLPRLEWPGTEKPAPGLPDGWRLADHIEYGRVIVPHDTPDHNGYICALHPDTKSVVWHRWVLCRPYELTYLDQ